MGIRQVLRSIRALLGMPDRLAGELRELDRSVRTTEKAVLRTSKRQDQSIASLSSEMASLRDEVHDRLLQYHLQLGRLSERVNGTGEPGHRVPVRLEGESRVSASADLDESSVATGTVLVPLDPDGWMELPGCPTCGTTDRTIVCEWNKLVLLASAPDEQSTRYDYAVCHCCGILYATRRPVGKRYRYLVDNFEDVIDKDAKNPLLNPHPLTDEDRDRYRRLIARGVFVSDDEPSGSLSSVLRDRMENAGHVDLLGSLLNPLGARVLEIRPRAGTILEGLRRLYGADVYAMPIWEGQQFIIQELYGIPTSTLIDFDRFQVPFEEPFDLIVCNHMFNHAVRLDGFLAAVRAALRTGGHLYLYNEIDDSEFLDGGQSMIATMNPLHLQASDRPSLVRALGAAGFEPVFVTGRRKRNVILVRKTDAPQWRPITDADRARRIAAYHRARDRAVLRVPERIRSRFVDVWPATVGRAVASGVARFDEKGELRIVKES